MKNILVTFRYDCGNGHADKYREMSEISVTSARENLAGPFEIVILGGPVDGADAMFRKIFEEEDRLYHAEPCNLLILGSDELVIRPCRIFGEYERFMMFGRAGCEPYNGLAWHPQKIYMSGTYYYPAGLPESLWEFGRKMAADWRSDVWDYCQYIYNLMFYQQGPQEEMVRLVGDPRLSYNLPLAGPAVDNKIPVEDAQIIHLHSSRDPDRVLEAMRAWKATRSIPERKWENGSPSYPAQ